jgi:O-glycosyl hydrolase
MFRLQLPVLPAKDQQHTGGYLAHRVFLNCGGLLLKTNTMKLYARFKTSVLCLLLITTFFGACSKNTGTSTTPPAGPGQPTVPEVSTTVSIDRNTKFQNMDGFGFFGAQDVWWGAANNMYSDAWATQVIDDLGITIWRNEYYPPSTPTRSQDADWNKQKPVVEGLARIAQQKKVPLKFIFTVWSPPADMKVALDADNNPISGTPNAGGTLGDGNNAGTLDPAKYTQFGNWLADGIQLYKNSGVDVYAISPQNEPLFKQKDFNSSFYKPQRWYGEMLKNSMPVVKARFPNVKIFGSENMLGLEAGKDRQWFYHQNLKTDPAALQNLDIWAVHGYVEGITPTATSAMATLWTTAKTEFMTPSGKPFWMTETSGYSENWKESDPKKAGALDLAMAIHAALYFGNASAWVWWQGSALGPINEYTLMQGTGAKGKKYYVSKQFYRFIRPNAKMVKVTYDESLNVLVSAFEHTQMGAFTVVLINNSDKKVKLNLSGADIPASFDMYTTDAGSANCTKAATAVQKDKIELPPSSVVTLVNGRFTE